MKRSHPPVCLRLSSSTPRSNSWLPTELKSTPIRFIASIVGSSRNSADTSGDAPIMSPDDVMTWFGFCAASFLIIVAKRPTPPAGTATSRSVCAGDRPSAGARIVICGGSRLPWKSLKAISLTFSGPSLGAGLVPAQAASAALRSSVANDRSGRFK